MSDIRQHLKQIPPPPRLHQQCVALAVLDCISGASFPKFSMAAGQGGTFHHFKLDDGGGNTLSIVFSREGCFLKGFDHESPMSPHAEEAIYPGLYHGFPRALRRYLEQPELLGEGQDDRFPGTLGPSEPPQQLTAVTFCAWRDEAAGAWRCGKIRFPQFDTYESDGAGFLLGGLESSWFEENHGWSSKQLKAVERHKPLDAQRIHALSASADVERVLGFMEQLGYGRAYPFGG